MGWQPWWKSTKAFSLPLSSAGGRRLGGGRSLTDLEPRKLGSSLTLILRYSDPQRKRKFVLLSLAHNL